MLQGLLITQDELMRKRLQQTLLRLGFGEVLTAAGFRETRTRLRRLGVGLRFVLLDADGWEGSEAEWLEVIAAIEEPLRRLQVPLVVVGSSSKAEIRARIRPQGQFHYCYLKKPFSISELQVGIEKACRRTMLYSQPLIYCGPEMPSSLRDELGWFMAGFHPHCEFTQDPSGLRRLIENLQGGPGVVLIDPKAPLSEEDIRWLRRFKMTPQGRRCRLVCLSRAPEAIQSLRTVAEIFWEPWGSWLAFVERVAISVAHGIFCDLLAEQAKKDLLDDGARSARAKIHVGLKVDPLNLRLRALGAEVAATQGRRLSAIKEYQAMLFLNPCLPQGYLKLWDCVDSGERPGLIRQALSYCPAHPEILSRSS